MPPKSEARQAQALPTFRCTIVVSPPPSLTHSLARPAAPTVIILMMTTIVLFLVPIVRPQMQVNVRDRSHSLSLSLSFSLSLFPFCCANRCTSCQKKRKKSLAKIVARNAPKEQLSSHQRASQHPQQREEERERANHQR